MKVTVFKRKGSSTLGSGPKVKSQATVLWRQTRGLRIPLWRQTRGLRIPLWRQPRGLQTPIM
jgi:hypothetical protein